MTYNQCKSDFAGGQIFNTLLGQYPFQALKKAETVYSFPAVLLFIKHIEYPEFNQRLKALDCVYVENPAESLQNELKKVAEATDEVFIFLDQNRDYIDYKDEEALKSSVHLVKSCLIPIRKHFNLPL